MEREYYFLFMFDTSMFHIETKKCTFNFKVSMFHIGIYIKESDLYYHNQCVSEKHEDHNDTFSFNSLKIVSIQTNG